MYSELLCVDESFYMLQEAGFTGWIDCYNEAKEVPTKEKLAKQLEDRILSSKKVEKAFSKCNDRQKEAKARGWVRTVCQRVASIICDDPGTFFMAAVLAAIVTIFSVVVVGLLMSAGTLFVAGIPINGFTMTFANIFALAAHATLYKLLVMLAGGASVYAAAKWLLGHSNAEAAVKGKKWLDKRKRQGEGGTADTARAALMLYPKDEE